MLRNEWVHVGLPAEYLVVLPYRGPSIRPSPVGKENGGWKTDLGSSSVIQGYPGGQILSKKPDFKGLPEAEARSLDMAEFEGI